jgi:hypothetical protein
MSETRRSSEVSVKAPSRSSSKADTKYYGSETNCIDIN